jgi:rhamnosyltransferase
MMNSLGQCAAAIVAHHPDRAILDKVISAIAPQANDVLLIANDGSTWSGSIPENVTLSRQETNLGLGAAYNLAVGWARKCRATHILLLDQDSVPDAGMVDALLKAFERSGPVAATGSLWRDSRTGNDGFFVRRTRWGAEKFTPEAGQVVPVSFLISSGSLISLDALADVGPFDESLFIEHVDSDWVLRAQARGYRLYGVADARLDHSFGENTLEISVLGPRWRVFLYPPERNYYVIRNSIVLWRRSHVPWYWVLRDIRRTILLALFYALFVPPRLRRIRIMFRAARDGLKMK